jgi:hypothetical protein
MRAELQQSTDVVPLRTVSSLETHHDDVIKLEIVKLDKTSSSSSSSPSSSKQDSSLN